MLPSAHRQAAESLPSILIGMLTSPAWSGLQVPVFLWRVCLSLSLHRLRVWPRWCWPNLGIVLIYFLCCEASPEGPHRGSRGMQNYWGSLLEEQQDSRGSSIPQVPVRAGETQQLVSSPLDPWAPAMTLPEFLASSMLKQIPAPKENEEKDSH